MTPHQSNNPVVHVTPLSPLTACDLPCVRGAGNAASSAAMMNRGRYGWSRYIHRWLELGGILAMANMWRMAEKMPA